MNKTSQWAGRFASLFSILFFVLGTIFEGNRLEYAGWIHVVVGWCMILAACSGVVCLVSAIFEFLRNGRKSSD
jgi:hypothetical protein